MTDIKEDYSKELYFSEQEGIETHKLSYIHFREPQKRVYLRL